MFGALVNWTQVNVTLTKVSLDRTQDDSSCWIERTVQQFDFGELECVNWDEVDILICLS